MDGEAGAGFTLRVEKGKKKGQVFSGDTSSVRIGREAPCEVTLDEDTISRHHATISFDGAHHLLTDEHSANGTFLNGKRVRASVEINHGDVIGFGPDLRVRYERTPQDGISLRKGRQPPATASGVSGVSGFLRQRPGLAVGLGLYIVGILVVGAYLYFLPSDQQRVTMEQAEALVQDTARFLSGTSTARPEPGAQNCAQAEPLLTEGKALEALADEDPGALYMAVRKYRQALRLCGYASLGEYKSTKANASAGTDVPPAVVQALEGARDRVLTRLRELLFRSWQAEGRGQSREAIRSYERILLIVPEERAPSYKFALERIRTLKQ